MSVFTPDLNLVWNQFRGWYIIILHPQGKQAATQDLAFKLKTSIIVRLKTKTQTLAFTSAESSDADSSI